MVYQNLKIYEETTLRKLLTERIRDYISQWSSSDINLINISSRTGVSKYLGSIVDPIWYSRYCTANVCTLYQPVNTLYIPLIRL